MNKSFFILPVILTAVLAFSGCVREAAYDATKSEGGKVSGYNTTDNKTASDSSTLVKEDIVVGTGTEAVSGKAVSVHYTGTLTNGTKFDSSKDRNEPFNFTLGAGQVIQGWDEGVVGMKVGGTRKLTIPAAMGYGSRDMGVIPPNSTLVFEVELLDVK